MPFVIIAPIVVFVLNCFLGCIDLYISSSVLENPVLSSFKSPAILLPLVSNTSPKALSTTTAPSFNSPILTQAIPSPDFIHLSAPNILPTVAPVPPPTQPDFGSFNSAFSQAFIAIALSGLVNTSPTGKSKIQL